LGVAHTGLDQLEKALGHYDAALQKMPDTQEQIGTRLDVLQKKGQVLQSLGKRTEAIETWTKAIDIAKMHRIDGKWLSLYYFRGAAHAKQPGKAARDAAFEDLAKGMIDQTHGEEASALFHILQQLKD
jgi:tetratricopeptide (TPR) repeat protein